MNWKALGYSILIMLGIILFVVGLYLFIDTFIKNIWVIPVAIISIVSIFGTYALYLTFTSHNTGYMLGKSTEPRHPLPPRRRGKK